MDYFLRVTKYVPNSKDFIMSKEVTTQQNSALEKLCSLTRRYYEICTSNTTTMDQVRILTAEMHRKTMNLVVDVGAKHMEIVKSNEFKKLVDLVPDINALDVLCAQRFYFPRQQVSISDIGFYFSYVQTLEHIVKSQNNTLDLSAAFRFYYKLKMQSAHITQNLVAAFFLVADKLDGSMDLAEITKLST